MTMNLPTSTFAALPAFPEIGESITFQLNGLAVVFLALLSIWGLLELMGVYFRRAGAQVQVSPVAVVPAPTPAAALPPETLAAIAAAVHVALGPRHRIHAIVPVSADLDWAHEGRRQIFASHQVR